MDFSKVPGVIQFFTPKDLTDEYADTVIESPSHFRYWLPTRMVIDRPGMQVPHDGRFWKTPYWVVNGKMVSLEELKQRGIMGKDRVMLMEVYENTGSENDVRYRLTGYALTTDTQKVIRTMVGDFSLDR